MREILFKGKRTVNDEWVEGFFNVLTKSAYLEPTENGYYITTFEKLDNGKIILNEMVEVFPSTIRQYTGFVDKNGKKIFEDDILERRHKELLGHSQLMVVQFDVKKACFTAADIGGGNVTFISDYLNYQYDVEIIGNVYDNPELLNSNRWQKVEDLNNT